MSAKERPQSISLTPYQRCVLLALIEHYKCSGDPQSPFYAQVGAIEAKLYLHTDRAQRDEVYSEMTLSLESEISPNDRSQS